MRHASSPEARRPASSNVVDPHRTAAEFGKLIVKLRWIGRDEEASALARHLATVAPEGFAFVPPADTD